MPIPPFWDALNPRLRKWIPLPGCSLPSWVAGHGWIIQNNSFLAGGRRGRGTTFQALFFSVTSLLSWGKELLARPQASPQTAGAPRRYGERREEVQAHLLLLSLLWEFLKAVRAQKTPSRPSGVHAALHLRAERGGPSHQPPNSDYSLALPSMPGSQSSLLGCLALPLHRVQPRVGR